MHKEYNFNGFQAVAILAATFIPWAVGVVTIIGVIIHAVVR